MKIRDAIKQAIETKDMRLLGQVVAHLRFRYGTTYEETLRLAQVASPGLTAGQWKEYLQECDQLNQ